MNKDDLIKTALEAAIKAQDVKVDGKNIDIIIVGKEDSAKLLSINEINNYLEELGNKMELS